MADSGRFLAIPAGSDMEKEALMVLGLVRSYMGQQGVRVAFCRGIHPFQVAMPLICVVPKEKNDQKLIFPVSFLAQDLIFRIY